jgi:hypothetical protein
MHVTKSVVQVVKKRGLAFLRATVRRDPGRAQAEIGARIVQPQRLRVIFEIRQRLPIADFAHDVADQSGEP